MAGLTARDFSQDVLNLFDRYVHGDIDRRGFLDQASRLGTGGMTAAGLLAALSPNFAAGQQIAPDDARLHTETMSWDSPAGHGAVKGYLCKPRAATGKLPTVLVVHENRGLNPHIEDITRRLALEGYLAMAPDALTPLGGYPGNEDDARALFGKLDQTKTRRDFLSGYAALQARPDSSGRLGVVGFCYGGGMAHWLATQREDLAAAVPFYGSHPPAEDAVRVKSALQIHFAENDERINKGWPPYEAALKAAGVRFEAHLYPGTQHGFNNDTTPRFDAAAASLAWGRTLAFFKQHLKA